jgi:hypothetical protein
MDKIKFWPMVYDKDGGDFGPCPTCGGDGVYIPIQLELDGHMFENAQGNVKCADEKCGLTLPVEEVQPEL